MLSSLGAGRREDAWTRARAWPARLGTRRAGGGGRNARGRAPFHASHLSRSLVLRHVGLPLTVLPSTSR